MKNEDLVVEYILNAPVDAVWNAITDPVKMKQWYFDIPGFKPVPGFEFQFTAGSENKKYVHLCKIKESIPLQKLSYTWRYNDLPGNTLVIFELFDEGEKTKVRLTHQGLETFPQDQPDFRRESFENGWTEIIGKNLKAFLEKN